MSERQFDVAMRELRAQLLTMGGLVEKAIERATEALKTRNQDLIAEVFEIEKKVNQCHISVDSLCLKLLALQHPFAVDLRAIVAMIKINTDLERMGDQGVNIAHNSSRYIKGPPLKVLEDLPHMFEEVRFMVRDALDSFVKSDSKLAREVLDRDAIVDNLKNKIFRDVLDHLKTKPEMIEQGLNLILVARNLERIGDHATNIAEDVIFAATGEDVRHPTRFEVIKGALSP